MAIAVVVLALVVAGQWLLVWKLIQSLLVQAKLPALGPVMAPRTQVEDAPPPPRKKVFTVPIQD